MMVATSDGQDLRGHRREAGRVDRPPADVLRRHRAGRRGHVNVSPKGPIESLRVLGPTRVAYLDVDRIGRGDDRASAGQRPHLRDAVRVRRPSADRPPPGQGAVLCRRTTGTPSCTAASPSPGVRGRPRRALGDHRRGRPGRASCGYGVPLMTCAGERPQQVRGRAEAAPGWHGRARPLRRREERALDRRAAGDRPGGCCAPRHSTGGRRMGQRPSISARSRPAARRRARPGRGAGGERAAGRQLRARLVRLSGGATKFSPAATITVS